MAGTARMTVTVDERGKVDLPMDALRGGRIEPGTELVVFFEAGKLVLLDPGRVRERMAAVDHRIRTRLQRSLAAAPDAPFFGGLTLQEYLSLSEHEEDALWERLSAEADQEADDAGEIDIARHQTSASGLAAWSAT